MTKLETLTPEMEALIPVVKQEWLELFYENESLDFEKAKNPFSKMMEKSKD